MVQTAEETAAKVVAEEQQNKEDWFSLGANHVFGNEGWWFETAWMHLRWK